MAEPAGEVNYAAGEGRDLASESIFEFGSRVGFWRLIKLVDGFQVPVTFFACAQALEKNPEAAREITRRGHEPCSHGYRWEEHFRLSRDQERNAIQKAVESINRTTGERPLGWYCRYGPSINTRELLVEEGGFVYDSDSYNDETPYFVDVRGKQHLVVPYTLDANDFRFFASPGFVTPSQFFEYLKESFDRLYSEGRWAPKMMSVGLHMRIIGRPARLNALERFIEYAQRFSGVWFARRIDIARWWIEQASLVG